VHEGDLGRWQYVKLDVGGLITAFGQACAYKLFARILFAGDDAKHPEFSIRARAARHEPDIFYVNRYLKLIEDEVF
jgi:hypothetical protein